MILERYGMTETLMNVGNPYEGERRPGTVGKPFAHVQVKICDEAGAPVPDGTTGERGFVSISAIIAKNTKGNSESL